jgi:hypothetical protein
MPTDPPLMERFLSVLPSAFPRIPSSSHDDPSPHGFRHGFSGHGERRSEGGSIRRGKHKTNPERRYKPQKHVMQPDADYQFNRLMRRYWPPLDTNCRLYRAESIWRGEDNHHQKSIRGNWPSEAWANLFLSPSTVTCGDNLDPVHMNSFDRFPTERVRFKLSGIGSLSWPKRPLPLQRRSGDPGFHLFVGKAAGVLARHLPSPRLIHPPGLCSGEFLPTGPTRSDPSKVHLRQRKNDPPSCRFLVL